MRPLLFFLLLLPVNLMAQPIGNEWIRPGQTYWKIPIAQTSLYRITYADLRNAGMPVNVLSPNRLQLFHRGREQAIFVSGERTGRFTPTDFVEFYGQRNDGTLDSLLYRPAQSEQPLGMPHAYYNLFSDTTAYFLTIGPATGRRMAMANDAGTANLVPEPYVWSETLRLFTEAYPGYAAGLANKVESSYVEAAEGYTGSMLQKNQLADQFLFLNTPYRAGPPPELEVLLVGREYTNHLVETYAGPAQTTRRPVDSVAFLPYENARVQVKLRWDDVTPDGQFFFGTRAINPNTSTDRYSVSYVRFRYPHRPTLGFQVPKTIQLRPNPANQSLLVLEQVPNNARLFDITDPANPIRLSASVRGDLVRVLVYGTATARTLFCVGEPLAVPSLRAVRFRSFAGSPADFIIVSHEQLMQSSLNQSDAVREYATYRASAAGGKHDTLVVTVGELFDQYSYGERSPLAIRRFCDELLRTGHPAFLLLLGRSRHPAGIRTNPAGPLLDLVPTGGYPGSDAVFTAGLNGFPPDVPALPTGRINAGTPDEVRAYLAKVQAFETVLTEPDTTDQTWRKTMLHLSGGRSAPELFLFKALVDSYGQRVKTGMLGALVTAFAKQTDAPTETIDLSGPVNAGVGLLTFFGHSRLALTDLDIGFASDGTKNYRNQGRYPLLFVNGCALGNFFYGTPTLGTDWLLTPNRGAIAVLAHSHLGTVDALDRYATQFYSLLADSTWLSRSIGVIQQETIRRVLSQYHRPADIANAHQMVLQGDPALRIFPFSQPDYAIPGDGISITKSGDSVRVQVVVANYGQYRARPLPIQLKWHTGGATETYAFSTGKGVAFRETLTIYLPNQSARPTEFVVTLNAGGATPSVPELTHANNEARLTIDFSAPQPVVPPPDRTGPLLEVAFDGQRITDGAVVSPAPVLDVLVIDDNRVTLRQDTSAINLYLKPATETGAFRRMSWRGAGYQPADSNNVFRLRHRLPILGDGLYQLRLTAQDAAGNPAAPYDIRFRVIHQPELTRFSVYPNPFHDQTTFAFELTGEQPPGNIALLISNLNGQMVRRLSQPTRIGQNDCTWDGRSDAGALVPAGVYLYALQPGDFPASQATLRGRVLLVR